MTDFYYYPISLTDDNNEEGNSNVIGDNDGNDHEQQVLLRPPFHTWSSLQNHHQDHEQEIHGLAATAVSFGKIYATWLPQYRKVASLIKNKEQQQRSNDDDDDPFASATSTPMWISSLQLLLSSLVEDTSQTTNNNNNFSTTATTTIPIFVQRHPRIYEESHLMARDVMKLAAWMMHEYEEKMSVLSSTATSTPPPSSSHNHLQQQSSSSNNPSASTSTSSRTTTPPPVPVALPLSSRSASTMVSSSSQQSLVSSARSGGGGGTSSHHNDDDDTDDHKQPDIETKPKVTTIISDDDEKENRKVQQPEESSPSSSLPPRFQTSTEKSMYILEQSLGLYLLAMYLHMLPVIDDDIQRDLHNNQRWSLHSLKALSKIASCEIDLVFPRLFLKRIAVMFYNAYSEDEKKERRTTKAYEAPAKLLSTRIAHWISTTWCPHYFSRSTSNNNSSSSSSSSIFDPNPVAQCIATIRFNAERSLGLPPIPVIPPKSKLFDHVSSTKSVASLSEAITRRARHVRFAVQPVQLSSMKSFRSRPKSPPPEKETNAFAKQQHEQDLLHQQMMKAKEHQRQVMMKKAAKSQQQQSKSENDAQEKEKQQESNKSSHMKRPAGLFDDIPLAEEFEVDDDNDNNFDDRMNPTSNDEQKQQQQPQTLVDPKNNNIQEEEDLTSVLESMILRPASPINKTSNQTTATQQKSTKSTKTTTTTHSHRGMPMLEKLKELLKERQDDVPTLNLRHMLPIQVYNLVTAAIRRGINLSSVAQVRSGGVKLFRESGILVTPATVNRFIDALRKLEKVMKERHQHEQQQQPTMTNNSSTNNKPSSSTTIALGDILAALDFQIGQGLKETFGTTQSSSSSNHLLDDLILDDLSSSHHQLQEEQHHQQLKEYTKIVVKRFLMTQHQQTDQQQHQSSSSFSSKIMKHQFTSSSFAIDMSEIEQAVSILLLSSSSSNNHHPNQHQQQQFSNNKMFHLHHHPAQTTTTTITISPLAVLIALQQCVFSSSLPSVVSPFAGGGSLSRKASRKSMMNASSGTTTDFVTAKSSTTSYADALGEEHQQQQLKERHITMNVDDETLSNKLNARKRAFSSSSAATQRMFRTPLPSGSTSLYQPYNNSNNDNTTSSSCGHQPAFPAQSQNTGVAFVLSPDLIRADVIISENLRRKRRGSGGTTTTSPNSNDFHHHQNQEVFIEEPVPPPFGFSGNNSYNQAPAVDFNFFPLPGQFEVKRELKKPSTYHYPEDDRNKNNTNKLTIPRPFSVYYKHVPPGIEEKPSIGNSDDTASVELVAMRRQLSSSKKIVELSTACPSEVSPAKASRAARTFISSVDTVAGVKALRSLDSDMQLKLGSPSNVQELRPCTAGVLTAETAKTTFVGLAQPSWRSVVYAQSSLDEKHRENRRMLKKIRREK